MNLQAGARCRLRSGQPVTIEQRPRSGRHSALGQSSVGELRGGRRRRRHQACQQTVSQFRWQRQAPLIDQRHVVAMSTLACRLWSADRARSPQRTLAIDSRQRPIGGGRAGSYRRLRRRFGRFLLGRRQRCRFARRQWFVLRHLPHQHVRQTNTTAFAGHGNGQLLVVHFLILLGCRSVERITLTQRVGRLAHGLEHFTEKQRLELLRHFAQVFVTVLVADLELVQAVEVRVGTRIRTADQTTLVHIHGRRPQITIRSACNAPACFSASRIAIKSPGAAPTWFTARTISSRVVPGPNLNIGLASC